MNIPFQVGLPQIVLLIIAIAGIGMLVSAIVGLAVKVKELEEYEDETGRTFRRWRHRRRFRWKRGSSGVIMVLLAILLLWITFSVQAYLGLTSDILVARVQAFPSANTSHKMTVLLTLFDSNGNAQQTKSYDVLGDEWMLEGDILRFPTWMNILGVHTGFKLTRLEGRYDDSNMERNSTHTVVDLNGGDDNFFQTAQNQAWTNPFVQAAYGNGSFVKPDGQTYDIFASQDALVPRPHH